MQLLIRRVSGVCRFCSQRQPKIFIDQEMIRKKMQQLKQSKQSSSPKGNKHSDLMPDYHIKQLDPRVKEFRRETNTMDLLGFHEQSLFPARELTHVNAFGEQGISVNSQVYPTSIVLTKDQTLIWEVPDMSNLTKQHFLLLKFIQPEPEYVIIGVPKLQKLKPEIMEYVESLHGNVAILELFEAISEHNITAADELNILTFLIVK